MNKATTAFLMVPHTLVQAGMILKSEVINAQLFVFLIQQYLFAFNVEHLFAHTG